MNLVKLKSELVVNNFSQVYIDNVISYAENLQKNNYLLIFDLKHLSLLSGISTEQLYAYYLMKEKLYRSFRLPKKTGGFRHIIAPSENLKFIQRWVLDNILNKVLINEHATGFTSNRSIVSNARKHVGKKCVVNLDIKEFFPSITFQHIYSFFIKMGYTRHLSMFLSGICTLGGVLPQGAPTSPMLSNLVCEKLDSRLSQLAEHIGADYTRYADDITFSGNKHVAKYTKLIKAIISDEGFQVNSKKVRVHYHYHRQMVTGLVVNEVLSVPRETKSYLRQQIYYSKKFGVHDNLLHQGVSKTNYKEHLYGLAYFIKMVEVTEGEKFIAELNQIDWES